MTQVYHYHFLGWLSFVCYVSLLLTGVPLWCSWCPKATLFSGSVSSMLFHCCSWGRLCIVPGFKLTLIRVAQCYHTYSTAAHCCGSLSSRTSHPLTGCLCITQVFHCQSLTWLHIFLGLPLRLTRVDLRCSNFLTATFWVVSAK